MGLYDTVELPAELSLPGLDGDPGAVEWQTKSIGPPAMRTFRVTAEGRLLEEDVRHEAVPPEERPYYGTDGWEEPFGRFAGSMREVHEGWSERRFDGVLRLVASVDGDPLRYEAAFTDGHLETVRRSGDDDWEWQPVGPLLESGPPARLGPGQVARLEALLDALEVDLDEGTDSASRTDHGRGRRSDARAGVESVRRYLDWRYRDGEE